MQNGLGNSMAGGSKRPEVDIGERMTSVRKAWDPQSPDCRFKVSCLARYPDEEADTRSTSFIMLSSQIKLSNMEDHRRRMTMLSGREQ